ncbi:MAG: hypothetical protein A2Y90_04570 [Chloroflexi bacterium RBG_13_52_12]|nr:MAG: hypothetical protein A2Y90_04570 [Chloroflexi bacterium RBG_13_52_12]
MFHSARWKAYLQQLQDNPEGEAGNIDNIYHVFHSQKLWFAREEKSNHQKDAEEHLKRSDALIDDCTRKVDALEETLANTPKPSEMLNWNTVTLQDLT